MAILNLQKQKSFTKQFIKVAVNWFVVWLVACINKRAGYQSKETLEKSKLYNKAKNYNPAKLKVTTQQS